MRDARKQSPKPIKPSPNPATMPSEPSAAAPDQDHGEGSYSGTRDYQAGVKAYLETADVEQDARNAAPDTEAEARDLEKAEQAGRRPGIKTQRSAKGR